MHVLIIGAGGMVGRKLAAALVKAGKVRGKEIAQFTLADVVPCPPRRPASVARSRRSPLTFPCPGAADGAHRHAPRPDLPSRRHRIGRGREADFEKGYRINMDGMRFLLEAIRLEGIKT